MRKLRQIPNHQGHVHKEAAQQPAYKTPLPPPLELYPVDQTVRYSSQTGNQICTIISGEHYTKPATAGLHDTSKEILHLGARYKIRALGTNKIFHADHILIEPLTSTDHLEIPPNPAVIDPADVQRCLTAAELHQLWNSASQSTSDDERLFYTGTSALIILQRRQCIV